MPANSPIQVVPIIATSGVVPAVIELTNFSWAESHGTGVTLTVMSGYSSSKPATRSGSASPSAPIAQTSSSPEASSVETASPVSGAASPPAPPSSRPQPVRARAVVVVSATSRVERRMSVAPRLSLAGEPGPDVAGARVCLTAS